MKTPPPIPLSRDVSAMSVAMAAAVDPVTRFYG